MRALTKRTAGGLQSVILAAWALLQSRLTGESDVEFAVAVRNRALGGSVRTSRAVSSLVTVKISVDAEQAVAALLGTVAANCAAQGPLPVSLQQAPCYLETAIGAPEFKVVFSIVSRSLSLAPGAHHAARVPTVLQYPDANAALQLTVVDAPVLEVHAMYDVERHTVATVSRWVDSLLSVVERLAHLDSATPSSQVDVLSFSERQRLVYDFNRTERPFAEDLRIADRFEERVQLQPNHVAVELGDVHLSYAELDARANQLAHLLLQKGCDPRRPIAVCLPRCPELVVALLAVAKLGAPYVPLDASYPHERLSHILDQSAASLVVTFRSLAARFHAKTLQLDGTDSRNLATMPATRPACSASATGPCYIMFTSGTTGGPKGVVLSHRAVVNTLEWVNRTFEIGPADRLLFVNTPCFDLSVYDVFGALGAGATLVMASDATLAEPVKLAQALVQQRITLWNSAPAALQQLVQFLPETPPEGLRLVLLSGDWIPVTLPTELQRFKSVRVVSLGGATEAAIWSNWFPIDRVDPSWTSIPYGKPIQNARYYVLDKRMRPVPIGVKGDLYIGGACLAEGYLERSELTAQRFVADPFCPGERIYQTGDLVRHREDGNLELLGRDDFQVKIRGFRVELAEVETALRALPYVKQAVCEARTDASGEKALVAHVVPEAGAQLTERSLRTGLAALLPTYMLPGRILQHAMVPLSCNGKVDRQALCEAEELVCAPPQDTATSSGTEQELMTLWQRLLGRPTIGLEENFFELGGHSLLALLLVTRIRERLGVELPVGHVIDYPTIASLARCVENTARLTLSGRHVHSYHPRGHRIPLILIPGVLGTVFTFRTLPKLLGADQPTHVVDFLGDHQRSLDNFRSVEAIAEYLEPHVTPLLRDGSAVLGGFSFGASVAYELTARLLRKGYRIPLLISFDGQAPGHPKRRTLPQRMVALGRALVQQDDGRPLQGIATVAGRLKHWMRVPELQTLPGVFEADPELERHLRRMSEAQLGAHQNYRPGFKQQLDILLFKAHSSAEPRRGYLPEADFGWREYLDGNVALATVPGEHLRLFDDSNLALLAATLTQHLNGLDATPAVGACSLCTLTA